jgi:hypothetical protein
VSSEVSACPRRARTRQGQPAPDMITTTEGVILSSGDTIEQVMAVTSKDGVITSVYFVGNPGNLSRRQYCDKSLGTARHADLLMRLF